MVSKPTKPIYLSYTVTVTSKANNSISRCKKEGDTDRLTEMEREKKARWIDGKRVGIQEESM